MPSRYVPFTGIHSFIFKLKYAKLHLKQSVRVRSRFSYHFYIPELDCSIILQKYLSRPYVGLLHNCGLNEHRPSVYTLHLKCFPIKGEQCPIENISYRSYSPPKFTCNGHVPHIHIHIPSKKMQFLLWNPTCHDMK